MWLCKARPISFNIELKQKFSFSYFRENFRFLHQNLTKSREKDRKYIYKLQK
jgi:hypothetical protein